jgi:hypothetical protein
LLLGRDLRGCEEKKGVSDKLHLKTTDLLGGKDVVRVYIKLFARLKLIYWV